jgi:SsrA-binding protein
MTIALCGDETKEMPRQEPNGRKSKQSIRRGANTHLKALCIISILSHSLRIDVSTFHPKLTNPFDSPSVLCYTNMSMAIKTISHNRKAHHDYYIEDTVEAGLALKGTEVKSLRQGRVSLSDAYARVENGELWLLNAHIAPYEAGNRYNHQPKRPRKLLLHRDEIASLSGKVLKRGFTLVPLRLYFKNGIAKVELGLAKGKRLYDKRDTLARRQAQRQMEQALRHRL